MITVRESVFELWSHSFVRLLFSEIELIRGIDRRNLSQRSPLLGLSVRLTFILGLRKGATAEYASDNSSTPVNFSGNSLTPKFSCDVCGKRHRQKGPATVEKIDNRGKPEKNNLLRAYGKYLMFLITVSIQWKPHCGNSRALLSMSRQRRESLMSISCQIYLTDIRVIV